MGGGKTDIIEVAGKVVVVGIILLFFLVIFLCCLHLYFKWFYRQAQDINIERQQRRRRRRLDFAAGQGVDDDDDYVCGGLGGLDGGVLKSIPIVVWLEDGGEDEGGLECAVCLCEVREGEKARILPKCNHGFHVECIDMWFYSHVTCPLCRNPIHIHEWDEEEEEEEDTPDPDYHVISAVWDRLHTTTTTAAAKDQPSTSAAASHSHAVEIDINY